MTVALPVVAPVLAAVLILLLRRRPAVIAVGGALVAVAAALFTATGVAGGARPAVELPGLPGLPLVVAAEPIGATLSLTTALVSAAVLIYAVGYMQGERGLPRFYAFMSLFSGAMQALVLAGDWILFLAAWEVIALSSYVLIGFWFERPGVPGAATRAFMSTRGTDLGLYAGLLLLIASTGSNRMGTVPVDPAVAVAVGLGLTLAAFGKSAQAPFQGWLQDAMAGPTPVSALLHSATLVVAGVVLILRAAPLLPGVVLATIGLGAGISAVVTGVMALAGRDLKRLLAASTSSQLGLMFLSLAAGSTMAALLHLVANAAMKSSLFLGAGVFQHLRGGTELARLGSIGRRGGAAFIGFALAGLALAGVPPLAGFWSKDAVLAATLEAPGAAAWLYTALALAASTLTGAYVGRTLAILWAGERTPSASAGEERLPGRRWMTTGMWILVAFAVALGPFLAILARFAGGEVPEAPAAIWLGLTAAGVGLLAGVLAKLSGDPSARWSVAVVGFRIDGGWDGLLVRPTLALAARLAATDRALHERVLGAGRAGLALARLARASDDVGLAAIVDSIVRASYGLAARVRTAQSGLVHRELLLAGGGVGALLLLMLGLIAAAR